MSAPGAPAPGRLSATNTGDNGASYRTALQGASLAFQRTGPRQPAQPTTGSSRAAPGAVNEAWLAATSSTQTLTGGRGSPTHPRSGQVSRNGTGTSSHANQPSASANGSYDHDHGSITPQRQSHITQALTPSHGASLLAPPGKSPVADVKSPSFIAATLAASRSNSPSQRQAQPHPAAHSQSQQTPRRRRMDSVGAQNASATSSSLSLVGGTDESSIPSTNALISMFEKGDNYRDPVKKSHSRHNSQTTPLAARPLLQPQTPSRATSPTLKGSASPSRQASSIAWHNSPTPQMSAAPRSPTLKEPARLSHKKKPPTPPPVRSKTVGASAGEGTLGEANADMRRPKPRPLTPPPRTVSRSQTVIVSPQPTRVTSQTLLSQVQPELGAVVKSRPAPLYSKPKPAQPPKLSPGLQRAPLSVKPNVNTTHATAKGPRRASMASTSSNDTFVSASSAPSPGPDSPRRRSRPPTPSPPRASSPLSTAGIPPRSQSHIPHAGPQHRASEAALDSLTSAIVAGSLASARATPTIKARTPPPPPPRKQTPRLKKTLRQPPSKSDDETNEQKYKKHRIRSNKKHSHHEGSRKRWRDEITARERKRYEGVWASNRGHLLQSQHHSQQRSNPAQDADSIVNVVARDIWSRSRLPFDELAEVWDLVDRDGRGVLGKTEFVVGMWLIDQRLRGRKIPQKVSDSVWGSAKGFEVVVGHPSRSKHRR